MNMKDIPGFEGRYAITTDGQVWSYKSNKFLSLSLDNNYYHIVLTNNDGERHKYRVNRLVALTYIPNPDNKPVVDHINRNPQDNRVENLRWVTLSENVLNTDYKYVIRPSMLEKASQVTSIPVQMCDKETHEVIREFTSAYQAAKIVFDNYLHSSLISRVCRGEKKSAYGYFWRYIK